MAKVKIQSSTLKKIIRGINGSPTLSLITKCVNSLRYTKYNGTSKRAFITRRSKGKFGTL